MEKIRVAGCDCGKDNLHICILEEVPKNLKTFARSYKPLKIKANAEGMAQFLALEVDLYVLEPTGSYSYIWIQNLQRAGRKFRLVSSRRVRHYCEYKGLINKADRPDAAAISAYTLENLEDDQGFLKTERLKIRELYLQINSTTRSKNPVNNRLGQRVGFEFPEGLKRFEETTREWLDPNPPAIYRFLAGETLNGGHSTKREDALKNTIGCGLSDHTRALAKQLCEFEKIEYALELELNQELSKPDYDPYRRVFKQFQIPPRIEAAILSRIYPFEDFLRDGKPFKEYVRGGDSHRRSGMTKRDRTEGEFKLSLGMGKILHQSGGTTEWKAGGAKYARTALWLYVKVMIVIRRSKGINFQEVSGELERLYRKDGVSPWLNPELIQVIVELTGTTPEVASLRLHYEFQTTKGDRRISATAGRFCRMLYKALLNEFVVR
jgi:hypothetical protein